MSPSSFIIPAEQKIDKTIKFILYIIWSGLIIFGIITMLQPVWLQKISQPGRESEALDLKSMGDNAMGDRDYGSAIDYYKLAIETDPELDTARGNMAIAYAQMGKTRMAEKTLLDMIERIPERSWIGYLNLGDIYREKGNYTKAKDYYQRAIENNPLPDHAYKMTAFCYKELGELEKALEYYLQALKIRDDFAMLYMGNVESYMYRYRKSEDKLAVLANLHKEANWQKNKHRYDQSAFEAAYLADGDVSKIYNEIGVIYYNLNHLELAQKALTNALSIDPKNVNAKKNLRLISKAVKQGGK